MYAVFDLETTGLVTGMHDRVIEVAVVHVAETGEVTDEWVTLVNPRRDLGPQHIHGIRAADVLRAPPFAQIAGHLAGLLRNRIPVAHNIGFDTRFLVAEYARLGAFVPLTTDRGLCTMGLASQLLPGAPRNLHGCTAAAGISLNEAHSALHDARATAALLGHYLNLVAHPPAWIGLSHLAKSAEWPTLPESAATAVTRRPLGHHEDHFLARLVDQMPRVPDPPEADSYLWLLDRALIDRHISATEADALCEHAENLGITRSTAMALHADYLRALARAAWQDGTVTADERSDIEHVAALLGLTAADAYRALDQARFDIPTDPRADTKLDAFTLTPGDLIVLTGQMHTPRDEWSDRARSAGLEVSANVTKKVRLVVAADPDSLSGKARKARDYGIPVVTEESFEDMLDTLMSTGSSPKLR